MVSNLAWCFEPLCIALVVPMVGSLVSQLLFFSLKRLKDILENWNRILYNEWSVRFVVGDLRHLKFNQINFHYSILSSKRIIHGPLRISK